ncbi:ABC transporter permease [Gloeobacter violaceus]|uniref:Gll1201 protein n=1 Tax=Gloeobacter violaceus (strain ATCC 29082 / PCC 7421) TaxID=251221 RepID=Q7NLC5_GLOVI|nr:ABC transporter permease [Gloeobacter violaceus]BAC89142.1 gll1201 [Gloeobacter violaceus PCC 7421]
MKSWPERIFEGLLKLYPTEFQQEYADEIVQVFREQHRELSRQGGGALLVRWWMSTAFDLGVTAVKEQMQMLLQDVRYGLRMLAGSPGFTVVAVLTLALAIGANTAIFSVVSAVLLRSLPYAEPERLVQVWETAPRQDVMEGSVSAPNYLDWREQNHVFDRIALYGYGAFNLSNNDNPDRLLGAIVSTNFFETFGTAPLLGRGFRQEEEKSADSRVAVISHGLWQRRFEASAAVLGKTVTIDSRPYTIVGVMPPGFQFPRDDRDIFVPFAFDTEYFQQRGQHSYRAVARLKPGVNLAQASEQMNIVARALARQYPDSNTGRGVALVPLYEELVGDIRPALLVLTGAVAAVLLIACANVANLLLARAVARQKEFALRVALGASRARLVRQLLTESALLSLFGGACGLVLAYFGVRLLVAFSPADLPRAQEIAVDGPVLAFTVVVAFATAFVFGLAPALQATRVDCNEALKDGGRTATGGRSRHRLRNLLVVGEVSLALMLLVGAGLLGQSLWRLQSVDPGLNPKNVLTANIFLPVAKYREERQMVDFFDRLLARIRNLPGVSSASGVTTLPLSGNSSDGSFIIEGRPPAGPGQEPNAGQLIVGPDYLQTMGIPLVRGRTFEERDRATSRKVALINETMARRFWPGKDPVGRRISIDTPRPAPDSWIEIMGIVKDARTLALNKPVRPEIYFPYSQFTWPLFNLVVRTETGDPAALSNALREQVMAIDPDQALGKVRTMEAVIAESIEQERFNALLLILFAVVALALSGVGIYGVMAYSVTQRTHEIGIRLALGAERGSIIRLVVGQGMAPAIAGVAIGLVAAAALGQLLSSLLFGVSAIDPPTFIGVAAMLLGVAFLACFLPARRATRVDPMVALRYE